MIEKHKSGQKKEPYIIKANDDMCYKIFNLLDCTVRLDYRVNDVFGNNKKSTSTEYIASIYKNDNCKIGVKHLNIRSPKPPFEQSEELLIQSLLQILYA